MIATAGTGADTVWLTDPEDGATEAKSLPANLTALALGTTGSGRILLLAADGREHSVQLWEPDTGNTVGKPLPVSSEDISAEAFGATTGGQIVLATASGRVSSNSYPASPHQAKTVRLWDPATGMCLATIHRRAEVVVLVVSGSQLAIGDDEGVVLLEFPRVGTDLHP